MYVVGNLEMAAANCEVTEFATSHWDKAVALYAGSQAGTEDGTGGYFLHALAQVECYEFGTCKKGDMAPVNSRVFDLFKVGLVNLENKNCSLVMKNAAEIKKLMTVPLVQGALRAAYTMDLEDDFQENTQGRAAAFAAALLPLVHTCNAGSATSLYRDMAPGGALEGSYAVVRGALENTYDCLGITCEDVGGLINLRGDGYLTRGEACGNAQPVANAGVFDVGSGSGSYDTSADEVPTDSPPVSSSESSTQRGVNPGLVVGLSFLVLCLVSGLVVAIVFANKKKKKVAKKLNDGVEMAKEGTVATEAAIDNEDETKGADDKEIV